MAVTSYDAHFGIQQDALARNGGMRSSVKRMTKEEYERFMNSPAMMKQAFQEEAVAAKTSKRDKTRMETDSSFKPEDSDWEQAPAFKFDRRMDYYRTLGVDEYECLDNVKKAYRRLSLVYHPDKTGGLDNQTKEEYKQIFIEIHNAYLVLSDNPTRRQYDKARDDQAIAEELYGKIGKKVHQFDAFVELEKMARRKSKPAVTVDVVLKVKLEKMFYGGIKRHRRARQREVFDGFVTETIPYELVVPSLCKDNYSMLRKHAGDHHKEAKPDHLSFKLRTKDHPRIKREGDDLLLRRTLTLHKGAIEEPYTSLEAAGLGGRMLLLFGRNPFYGMDKPATSHLHVAVRGEGFGRKGRFCFDVEYSSDHKAVQTESRVSGNGRPARSKQMVVTVTHRDSGGECCVIMDLEATFGDVLGQLVQVVGLPGVTAEDFTLHRKLVYSDGLGPKLNPSSKVGTFNEVFCMGLNWVSASLSASRSLEFISRLSEAVEAAEDAFMKNPAPVIQLEDVSDVSEAEPPSEVKPLLPYFGFTPTSRGLKNALQAASVHHSTEAEEFRERLRELAVGGAGGVFTPPATRRTAPLHPVLRQRQMRGQGHRMECHTELVSLGAPLELATWPSSQLEFYGNIGQNAIPQPGDSVVRARPLYAVVLSCPYGAKKCMAKEWAELKWATMHLLVHTLWILVRPARSLQPKPLDACPAWYDEEEEEAVSTRRKKPREPRPSSPAREFVMKFNLGPPGGFPELPLESGEEEGEEGYADAQQPATSRVSKAITERYDEVAQELAWRFEEMPLYPWTIKRPPRPPRRQRASAMVVEEPPMPWSRLGEEAFGRGDAWMAYGCFTRAARAVGFSDVVAHMDERDPVKAMDERVGGAVSSSAGCKAMAASAVARRSDCLLQVGEHRGALADARLAAQLQPNWSLAWRRVGVIAARLGINSEAKTALSRAVELNPHDRSSIEMLQRFKWSKSDPRVAARSEKIAGNGLFKSKPTKAIAAYTLALSAMQVPVDHSPSECDEETAKLLAEIHSNRSGAFAHVGAWELAVDDARRALELPGWQDWVKGRLRLGTALLGLGHLEEAYAYFRKVELAFPLGVPDDHLAKRGRNACLSLLPLWKSPAGKARLARFWKDGRRSPESTRIFAVSDVHFDHPGADDWVSRISNTKFQEDILIVAGDIGESLVKTRACLMHLRFKFRRLFFVPGNHDLWIHSNEEQEVPDSFAKLFSLLQLCDEVGVDVFPAAVCKGVFVVPLFSWYNADFDVDDPFASVHQDWDKFAKWPIDKENHLWRYMLYMNRRFLEMPYPGTVLTFSHFLPRPELPYWNHVQGMIKAVGCPQLDAQLRQVRSNCHIFGHSHIQCNKVVDGVRYIQSPLGYQDEHTANEPLRCVYDGRHGGLVSRAEAIGG